MNRGKHKKLYYVPGLISLALLPLLLVYIGEEVLDRFNKNVLYLNVTNEAIREELGWPIPERAYTELAFTGDSTHDSNISKYIKSKTRGYIASNDTLNGLHILFDSKAKYASLVEVLNYNSYDNGIVAGFTESGIWMFYRPPYDGPYLICGTSTIGDPEPFNLIDFIKDTTVKYLPTITKLWPSLLLLAILTAVSLNRTLRLIHKPSPNILP